jgi:hypothetical protein
MLLTIALFLAGESKSSPFARSEVDESRLKMEARYSGEADHGGYWGRAREAAVP